MSNMQQRVSKDRFGNDFVLKLAGQVVNKKSGETYDGIFKTYVEMGGKLLKIEVSPANKSTKDGRSGVWVKVTKVNKQRSSNSF